MQGPSFLARGSAGGSYFTGFVVKKLRVRSVNSLGFTDQADLPTEKSIG